MVVVMMIMMANTKMIGDDKDQSKDSDNVT